MAKFDKKNLHHDPDILDLCNDTGLTNEEMSSERSDNFLS